MMVLQYDGILCAGQRSQRFNQDCINVSNVPGGIGSVNFGAGSLGGGYTRFVDPPLEVAICAGCDTPLKVNTDNIGGRIVGGVEVLR